MNNFLVFLALLGNECKHRYITNTFRIIPIKILKKLLIVSSYHFKAEYHKMRTKGISCSLSEMHFAFTDHNPTLQNTLSKLQHQLWFAVSSKCE